MINNAQIQYIDFFSNLSYLIDMILQANPIDLFWKLYIFINIFINTINYSYI